MGGERAHSARSPPGPWSGRHALLHRAGEEAVLGDGFDELLGYPIEALGVPRGEDASHILELALRLLAVVRPAGDVGGEQQVDALAGRGDRLAMLEGLV